MINIYLDKRPKEVQNKEYWMRIKDWETKRNVFVNPYDKTEFYLNENYYKEYSNFIKVHNKTRKTTGVIK